MTILLKTICRDCSSEQFQAWFISNILTIFLSGQVNYFYELITEVSDLVIPLPRLPFQGRSSYSFCQKQRYLLINLVSN